MAAEQLEEKKKKSVKCRLGLRGVGDRGPCRRGLPIDPKYDPFWYEGARNSASWFFSFIARLAADNIIKEAPARAGDLGNIIATTLEPRLPLANDSSMERLNRFPGVNLRAQRRGGDRRRNLASRRFACDVRDKRELRKHEPPRSISSHADPCRLR